MPPVRDESKLAESPPRYSLVFIIHGDADYFYHDTLGKARRADREVLAEAQAIGAGHPNAEVFIFHEIERRHVLFLIPRRDGRAYYYRHGRLVAQESYWRDQGDSRFAPEVQLYQQLARMYARPSRRFFFYFGHGIPEFGGPGYDASYSERGFTIDDLAEGVRDIAGESARFDLLTLATCFGGTPHTIGALAPYARTIVASPDNLHLTYFCLEPWAELDIGSDDGEVAQFADRFARHAFEELASEIQTAVSVVVYDTDGVSAYINAVADAYDRTLSAAQGLSPTSVGHCDCGADSTYSLPDMSEGLTVLYRAPRFGRMKLKQSHSGWECRRIAESGPQSRPGAPTRD